MRNNAAKPRIIEFFGLPGSGKTTIANRCIEIAKSSGRSAYSSDEVKGRFLSGSAVGRVGRIAVAGPLAWSTVCLGLRAPPFRQLRSEGRIRYRVRSAFNAPVYFLPLKDMEGVAEPAVIFLDEWITQKMWATSLFEGCEPAAAAAFIRRFVTQFDVQYVILDLDPDVAAERAHDRSQKRRQGMDGGRHPILDHMEKNDLAAIYQRGHKIFSSICGLLEDCAAGCIRLDGNLSAEENSQIVSDTLISPQAERMYASESCLAAGRSRTKTVRRWRTDRGGEADALVHD